MLSYRHAYHAGNYADILKHYCLFEILAYFTSKAKPFCYIDTHAGTGLYSIDSEQSNQTLEYQMGVMRLIKLAEKDSELQKFVVFLTPFIKQKLYPGSPWIAQSMMPNDYPIWLYELHHSDYPILSYHMNGSLNKRIKVFQCDGLSGLLALLPPIQKRAVVLVDPSYEVKTEYLKTFKAIEKAHKKFSTGCFVIWYPLLDSKDGQQLVQRLMSIDSKYLNIELLVAKKKKGYGMYGSGLFIINPPYPLPFRLKHVLPQLMDILKQDSFARYVIKTGKL